MAESLWEYFVKIHGIQISAAAHISMMTVYSNSLSVEKSEFHFKMAMKFKFDDLNDFLSLGIDELYKTGDMVNAFGEPLYDNPSYDPLFF